MNREEKVALVEQISAEIDSSEAIFAVDYRGISVPQAAELRVKLREADATFKVVKNRLTKLAAEKSGVDGLAGLLQGPTALTFVKGDTAQAAKAITTFNKEHDVITYKGGFMGETILDQDRFSAIAKLPSRDVLNGQLAGVVASPIVTLTRGLGSMVSGLAIQLQQIAEQGLVGQAAPEAEAGKAEAGKPDADVKADGPEDGAEASKPDADAEEAGKAEAGKPDADVKADGPEDGAEAAKAPEAEAEAAEATSEAEPGEPAADAADSGEEAAETTDESPAEEADGE